MAVVTDRGGLPLAFAADAADAGEVHLAEAAVRAVPVPTAWGTPLLADKGFDSDALRGELAGRGYRPLARHRRNRRQRSSNDGRRLRRLARRWRVERANAWLKTYRRAGVRYETYPDLHEGFVSLAFAFIALNPFLKEAHRPAVRGDGQGDEQEVQGRVLTDPRADRLPERHGGGRQADGRARPEYAPLVRLLFEWYATGLYSLSELVEKAHAAGFVYRKSRRPVARAAVHKLLTNRMVTGSFVWKGRVHAGNDPPLIDGDLWEKVQGVLRGRNRKKTRKGTRTFAFTRLIACGHCGCALVGEIKKGRYTYYHCTGFKGKCPEPFVREEVLEEKFVAVLGRIAFDDEVLALVVDALRESHRDAKRFHAEAVERLRAEHTKLQHRVEAAYEDKLDGTITAELFERKSAEWRGEQDRLLRLTAQHQSASQTY